MDFFEAQRISKKKTNSLLIQFFSVVTFISLISGFMPLLFLHSQEEKTVVSGNLILFSLAISLIVAFIIMSVSFFKIKSLKSNPEIICLELGAKKIHSNEGNLDIKRFQNIVEEMSIASGVPIPSIYILEESGINAFACGHDIHSSAICITRGALQKLNRNEIQAVVGHEFSHILNGDMNINLKLVGVLAGLLFISNLGQNLLRSRSRRRSKDGDIVGTLGFVFILTGSVGAFFGSFLRAKISREREYLADASSVQFTRNPGGIIGVLLKIMANLEGAVISHKGISDACHMCISNPFERKNSFFSFSTHTPLRERILAVDKKFNKDLFQNDNLQKLYKSMNSVQKVEEKEKMNTNDDAKSRFEQFGIFQTLLNQDSTNEEKIKSLLFDFLKTKSGLLSSQDSIKFLTYISDSIKNFSTESKLNIKNELLNEIKKDNKFQFIEFIVYGYLYPALEPIDHPFNDLSNGKFKQYSLLLLSFIHHKSKNSIYSFKLYGKKYGELVPVEQLNYSSVLKALKYLRFAGADNKEDLIKVIKEMIYHDRNVSEEERLSFYTIAQILGIPKSKI